ncbi:hypothetical protein E2K73_07685 [Acinetobacter sp. RF15A]|uniref:hypothetical protein n=1 Tax=unclassified Acinetobacter TaxID=196816 RepID=UPI00118EA9CB|nr:MULTISPECIES: hypothetical protein [unclassified Acinetobacter]TSH74884.1 hypothetical protein E2K73_07685 [Acinetobacter sp. RF15A]TSI20419.1 hypothetical protein E2K74_03020 [Acinetobacter sp. RF15B]
MKKIILLALLVGLAGCGKQKDSTKNIVDTDSTPTQIEQNTWQVVVHTDEMRGSTSKWLALRSENTANLDFPYDGENYLTLDILGLKTNDVRIFFTIDKGQYDCKSYGCYGAIKFGNSAVQNVDFKEYDASGNDGTILIFKGNTEAFLNNIRKVKEITVELPFYRSGSRQFKFKTIGFNEAEKKI